MADIRKPIQKRSIEKKQKILRAGFELFCEKGYYKTNTIEIAKRAEVSTGAVYSYFKDKKEIYIAAFESYLNDLSERLFEKLQETHPFTLPVFVDKWIAAYLELYASTGRALAQIRMMVIEDKEINHHFSASENAYMVKIAEILEKNEIRQENMPEKLYICCVLIDTLRQEQSVFSHSELDFAVLKQQVGNMVINLLSN